MTAKPTGHPGRVRWGILSTANIARKAVGPAIAASANGVVHAVASRDAGKAGAFARALGAPQASGSYEALLARDDVDAVYIALPNGLHREWVLRAVEAGKHVLCEKPLGASEAECSEMAAAADAGNVVLMEAFMYRFHPRTRALAAAIRHGAIGELRLVRSSFTFAVRDPANIRLDPRLAGGSLMDVGCYCVNISRTLFGAEPTMAFAQARWSERGVDLGLAGTLSFDGGGLAQFHSALDLARDEVVEVVGTEGRIFVESAFLPGKGAVSFEIRRADGSRETRSFDGADEYQLMVEHFADCVLAGTQPEYGAHEASRNMAAIDALAASARSGGTVITMSGS